MVDTERATILVVDDQPMNIRVLASALEPKGYIVESAENGEQALRSIDKRSPDLVLLDVVMPGMSGIDVCRQLRADARYAALPIVLVTALDADTERVRGLEAGADDFLSKPVNAIELLARVRSLLRVKRLFDRTQAQATELASINDHLAELVATKVAEVQRLSRLRRFVSPQLAARIVAGIDDDPLRSHRRDVVVVFFDLRGFTAFAETAAPEDVMALLREFHETLGVNAQSFGGTIERFAGDGVMVFFNDPEPIAEPCAVAASFAYAVVSACQVFLDRWRRSGFKVDVSAGLAYGYATLGPIGFGDRLDYGAIGSVTNLAARLCAEASGGEILLGPRAAAMLPARFSTVEAGPFVLKGFRDPIVARRLLPSDEKHRDARA